MNNIIDNGNYFLECPLYIDQNESTYADERIDTHGNIELYKAVSKYIVKNIIWW